MANKDASKLWFETGDYPTQAQFAQVFEWLRWKDEAQGIETITGLQDILNGLTPAGSIVSKEVFVIDSSHAKIFTILAGFCLTQMVILPIADCTPEANYQTQPVGEGLINVEDMGTVTAAEGFIWTGNVMAVTDRQIGVYNVPFGSTVIFIKIKIV